MLLVLLYALLVLSLFVLRRTQRITKEMPASLIQTLQTSDPVCMARMLQYHAHQFSTLDVLLVLSKSSESLRHIAWPMTTDFSTLQYIAWMCPDDTSTVIHRLPPLPDVGHPKDISVQIPDEIPLEALPEPVPESLPEPESSDLPVLPESPPRKKVKKVTKRSVQKQDEKSEEA